MSLVFVIPKNFICSDETLSQSSCNNMHSYRPDDQPPFDVRTTQFYRMPLNATGIPSMSGGPMSASKHLVNMQMSTPPRPGVRMSHRMHPPNGHEQGDFLFLLIFFSDLVHNCFPVLVSPLFLSFEDIFI